MDNGLSPRGRTVMIVDDEFFFRQLLRDIVEKHGLTVIAEASDGPGAVENYMKHRPDLTLMDIFMPDGNGIEATREIVGRDSAARVLICSGVGYDDDIDAALAAGAKDIIYKPFLPEEVIACIRKVLGSV